MDEEGLPVFGKVGGGLAEQFHPEGFVHRGRRDSKRQRFDHILHKLKIGHPLEDRSELHEHSLGLDTVAEVIRDFVELLRIDLRLLLVDSLDHCLHVLSEVVLLLVREHAHQIDLLLHQLFVLEIDRVDLLGIDIHVGVDQRVEVVEQHDEPLDYNHLGVGLGLLIQVFRLGQLILLQLLDDVVEVLLVFHDVEDYFLHLVVDLVDHVFVIVLSDEDNDDFDD